MSIVNFYKDKEIFITGGSGFVGKVLIEKILRSLPNVGKIYVLLRSRKGQSGNDRLQAIFKIPLFRRVLQEQPDIFKKVVAIAGDCEELGLGISADDMTKIRNVNIIFHSAASVRFDNHLKSAILLNTRGTYELVKLAETMPNLQAFVHVSTTYAHPNLKVLEEKIYPPYADWRTAIKLAETYDAETLDVLFSKYSSDFHPNSYTFTKSLAEHVIDDHCDKLPMVIFRPSIVMSTAEEPFPGWVDNFNGPIGLLVACGIGIMRTCHSDPDVISDMIPVDICAKAAIIAAFKLANKTVDAGSANGASVSPTLEVVNCASSTYSYLSISEFIDLCKKNVRHHPFEKGIWLPDGNITRIAFLHYLRFITFQILPALLLDGLLCLANQKPLLMKLQRRVHFTINIVGVFLNTQWLFRNDNLMALEDLIPSEERSILSFRDSLTCDQDAFISNGIIGAKEFLLKETPESSPNAHLRLQIFRVLHYTFQFIVVLYIAKSLFYYCYYSFINSS